MGDGKLRLDAERRFVCFVVICNFSIVEKYDVNGEEKKCLPPLVCLYSYWFINRGTYSTLYCDNNHRKCIFCYRTKISAVVIQTDNTHFMFHEALFVHKYLAPSKAIQGSHTWIASVTGIVVGVCVGGGGTGVSSSSECWCDSRVAGSNLTCGFGRRCLCYSSTRVSNCGFSEQE